MKDNALETKQVDLNEVYLAKKKRTVKIIYSVIMAVVLAIAVTIITLSCVVVDNKPMFVQSPTSYKVTVGGKVYTVTNSDSKYDDINALLDDSFKTTYLTALFAGKLGGYEIVETENNFYTDSTTMSSPSTTLLKMLGDNYIQMHFKDEQVLLNADGSERYFKQYSENYTMKFVDVYFNLTNADEDHELTFYVGTYGEPNTTRKRITKVTVKANTYQLYDLFN